MDKKISTAITIAALLFGIVGIIIGARATSAKNEALQLNSSLQAQLGSKGAAPTVAGNRNTNETDLLKAQLAQSESELARLRAQLENQSANRQDQMRNTIRDRLAELQQDPERAAQAEQILGQVQNRIGDEVANRMAMFNNLDTSRMTDEEYAVHTQLIEAISSAMNATQSIDLTNPESLLGIRDAMGSMQQIGPLMERERSTMFKQLGEDMGFAGNDASAFADYAQSIIDSTSMTMGGMGGMGGGRGGRF